MLWLILVVIPLLARVDFFQINGPMQISDNELLVRARRSGSCHQMRVELELFGLAHMYQIVADFGA
jgi:hypothetical protein